MLFIVLGKPILPGLIGLMADCLPVPVLKSSKI